MSGQVRLHSISNETSLVCFPVNNQLSETVFLKDISGMNGLLVNSLIFFLMNLYTTWRNHSLYNST